MMRISLLLLVCGVACGQPNNESTKTGKGKTLVFTEELRFGDSVDNDNLYWTGANCFISAAPDGRVFVSDSGASRVLSYTSDGSFDALIGGKGQGPGEYQGVPTFMVFSDLSALGIDAVPNSIPRANTYSKGPTFEKAAVLTEAEVMPIVVSGASPDGSMFGGLFVKLDMANGKVEVIVGVMDREYQLVRNIGSFERPLPDQSRMSDPGYWVEYLSGNMTQALKGSGQVAFDAKGRVYTAVSNTYEITRWAPDGKTKDLVMTRKYKPVPFPEAMKQGIVDNTTEQFLQNPMLAQIITQGVIERAVDATEFPPAQNPIQGLIALPDGHLIVLRDLGLSTGIQKFDLFSPDGTFHSEGELEGNTLWDFASNRARMTFGKDKAYAISVNDEGGIEVVRYSYAIR